METNMGRLIICDAFSLRQDEVVYLFNEPPTDGRWFAVMAASVPPMPGQAHQIRDLPGLPKLQVENYCIIACHLNDGKYVWIQLAPMTKEIIGDLLFESGLEKNKWHYALVVTEPPPPKEQP